MIIATQTVPTSASAPTDLPVDLNRLAAGGIDDDGTASDPASGLGFGTLLALQLRPDGADDLPPLRTNTEPTSVALGSDGRPILVATSEATSIPIDVAATLDPGKAPGRTAGNVLRDDDGRTVDDGSQAGNDLAAQLAIVSQWAAIAKPSTTEAPKDPGVDVQRKLETVRGTARLAADPTTGAPSDRKSDAGATADVAGRATPFVVAAATPAERPSCAVANTAATVTKALAAKAADATSVGNDAPASRAFESLGAAVLAAFDGTAGDPSATGPVGALVAQVTAHQTGERIAPTVAATPVAVHETVGTPAWSHEVAQATLRMAANDLQTASLQLNPAHLGPLDIQMRIDNGVAHVAFGAAHADTRHALESSRATLDQLFGDQGLKLGDCSVNDSSSSARGFATNGSDAGASRRDGSAQAGRGDTSDRDAPAATVALSVRKLPGLVDTFA